MDIEVSITPLEIDGTERRVGDDRRVVLRPSLNTSGRCVDIVVPGDDGGLDRVALFGGDAHFAARVEVRKIGRHPPPVMPHAVAATQILVHRGIPQRLFVPQIEPRIAPQAQEFSLSFNSRFQPGILPAEPLGKPQNIATTH